MKKCRLIIFSYRPCSQAIIYQPAFFIATIQIGVIVQVCYTPLARCVTYTVRMVYTLMVIVHHHLEDCYYTHNPINFSILLCHVALPISNVLISDICSGITQNFELITVQRKVRTFYLPCFVLGFESEMLFV